MNNFYRLCSNEEGNKKSIVDDYKTRYQLKECFVFLGDVRKLNSKHYQLYKPNLNLEEVTSQNIIPRGRAKYKCNYCVLKFVRHIQLKNHLKSEHPLEFINDSVEEEIISTKRCCHICPLCNETFFYKINLRDHMKDVHDDYEKELEADITDNDVTDDDVSDGDVTYDDDDSSSSENEVQTKKSEPKEAVGIRTTRNKKNVEQNSQAVSTVSTDSSDNKLASTSHKEVVTQKVPAENAPVNKTNSSTVRTKVSKVTCPICNSTFIKWKDYIYHMMYTHPSEQRKYISVVNTNATTNTSSNNTAAPALLNVASASMPNKFVMFNNQLKLSNISTTQPNVVQNQLQPVATPIYLMYQSQNTTVQTNQTTETIQQNVAVLQNSTLQGSPIIQQGYTIQENPIQQYFRKLLNPTLPQNPILQNNPIPQNTIVQNNPTLEQNSLIQNNPILQNILALPQNNSRLAQNQNTLPQNPVIQKNTIVQNNPILTQNTLQQNSIIQQIGTTIQQSAIIKQNQTSQQTSTIQQTSALLSVPKNTPNTKVCTEKNYRCGKCKKSYNSFGVLQKHIINNCKDIEEPEKKFKCVVCGKLFECDVDFKKHVDEHMNSKGKNDPMLNTLLTNTTPAPKSVIGSFVISDSDSSEDATVISNNDKNQSEMGKISIKPLTDLLPK